jgi:DNA-binding PadR family transcriptional regulator
MSVRNALLGLLAQRSRHGYELHAAFEALIGGVQNWDLKPAQVFTTLSRLEDAGLVAEETPEAVGGPEKRIFAITPLGRDELRGWFATPVQSGRRRDEFFLKLMLSLAVGENHPLRIMQIQRASLFQSMHDLTVRRSQANPRKELAQILLLDQAIMHVEADLRWLDMIEARLGEIQNQPLPEPETRPRGRPPKINLPAGNALTGETSL